MVALALVLTTGAAAQDYPAPLKALVGKGVAIKGSLPAPPGFKGFVGEYGGRRIPIYVLPDGRHMLIGTLFDEAANDLTQAPMQEAGTPVLDASTWDELGKASWIAEGSHRPKRIVYVFTDTECPYCHKLWQAMQPLLAGGDVQVRHIMVAVIAPASLGRAAAILDATDPAKTLNRHETDFGHSPVKPEVPVSPAAVKRIKANIDLMARLGIDGTPATIYKDPAGNIRRVPGLPPDERIKEIFGQ